MAYPRISMYLSFKISVIMRDQPIKTLIHEIQTFLYVRYRTVMIGSTFPPRSVIRLYAIVVMRQKAMEIVRAIWTPSSILLNTEDND